MGAADLALVFVVGVLAGVINTLAGGGSLLTLPLLVELGLPPTSANATNRVAVWMQSVTSAGRFRAKGFLPVRASMPLVASSLVGVVAGALAAARIADDAFRVALAVVFAGMGVVLVRRLLVERGGAVDSVATVPGGPRTHLSMLAVGFYAGFVQAGVGVLVIWVLHVVGRLDIVRSNAVKTLLVWVWTTIALVVFVASGLVDWHRGLLLGVGGAIGAWAAVGLATRVDPRALKIALAIGVWIAAARFAGLF